MTIIDTNLPEKDIYSKAPSDKQVRRLYCLECGNGAFSILPCHWFVAQHSTTHKFRKDEVESKFIVLDRGSDREILLTEHLDKMLTNPAFEWGGALIDFGKEGTDAN